MSTGTTPRAIAAAIESARSGTGAGRPTLICCKTVIGKGSPNKAGTDAVHGAALGDKEVAATREAIGWKHAAFEIPREVYSAWDATSQGAKVEADWNARFAAYEKAFPGEAREFKRRVAGELPAGWSATVDAMIAKAEEKAESIASRKASQNALEAIGAQLPGLIGGSADLTGSNLTMWSGSKAVTNEQAGNYIYFGVREFAMAAIGNGLALHGGFIPYSGTFLTFSDYSRNALRMAGPHARAQHLRLHARFHRPGRGRPHAPVDRACGVAAPHPPDGRLAPVRHGGNRGGVGVRHRAQGRALLARPVAPEPAFREARRRALRPTSAAADT
jgi:transketolase